METEHSSLELEKTFNLTSRYTDYLISINNLRFKHFLKGIYPEELVVLETSESRNVVSYMDLLIDYHMVTLFARFLTGEMHLSSIALAYGT